jgi:hypothetical protein
VEVQAMSLEHKATAGFESHYAVGSRTVVIDRATWHAGLNMSAAQYFVIQNYLPCHPAYTLACYADQYARLPERYRHACAEPPARSHRREIRDVEEAMADEHTVHSATPVQLLAPVPGVQAAPDLRIQLRELIHTRGEPIVTVTLALHGRRVVGIGRGQGDPTARLECTAADATVQAITRLITPMPQLRLEHVERMQIGQLDLCLVQLTVVVGDDQQTAIGVSRIRGDSAEAAARAVLDATNRFLARLMPLPA